MKTTTEKVIQMLEETLAGFRLPYFLKPDNGPQFRREQFYNYININGILYVTNSPLWPQANSEAEVFDKRVNGLCALRFVSITPYDFLEETLSRLPLGKGDEANMKRHAQSFVEM